MHSLRAADHPRLTLSALHGALRQRPGLVKLRAFVLDRDSRTCHYCGAHANTIDHVDPASKTELTTDPGRLVAACQTCNSRKRDSLIGDGGRV